MRRSEADAKKLLCHLSMARSSPPCKCYGSDCQAWEWVFGQPEIGAIANHSLCIIDADGRGQPARDKQLKRLTDNGWKLNEPLDPTVNRHQFKFVGPKKGFCQALHLDVNVETH